MRVLLAVDGSEAGEVAVEESARIPWPEGSVMKVVSVAESPLPARERTAPLESGFYEEWERMVEGGALEIATRAMARFGEIAGGAVEARAKTLKGDPKVAILDEAENWSADLIIVGTHGYNALERLWIGSVSRSVATHAKCSVRIARPRGSEGAARDYGKAMRILLAVDGSEFSDMAVKEIADRPWPVGSHVHVISVIHLPFQPGPEVWSLPESYYYKLEMSERERSGSVVDRAIERLSEANTRRDAPLTLTSEAVVGRAAETIIGTAEKWGADLVVVGSHGYRGFTRFLLGSVSYAVASHAPCSVEIVRNNEWGRWDR